MSFTGDSHLLGGGRVLVHDPPLLEDLRPLTIDVYLPYIHLGLDAEMGYGRLKSAAWTQKATQWWLLTFWQV